MNSGYNEFLTVNANTAYPLADGGDRRWNGLFLDARGCTSQEGPVESRISTISYGPDGITVTGTVGEEQVSGKAAAWTDGMLLAGLRGTGTILRLVLSEKEAAALGAGTHQIGATIIPSAVDCDAWKVRSVEVCSGTGLFESSAEGDKVSGDVSFRDDYGIAVSETTSVGDGENVIQVDAVASDDPACSTGKDQYMNIRGDDCLVLASIPNAKVVDGLIVPWTDDGSDGFRTNGVIVVDSVCTACCKCDDYKEAVDRLREIQDRVDKVYATLRADAEAYAKAVTDFNALKDKALDEHVDSFKHVMMSLKVYRGWSSTSTDSKSPPSRVSVVLSVFNGSTTTIGVIRPEVSVSDEAFSNIGVATSASAVDDGVQTGDGETALAPGGSIAYMYKYSSKSTPSGVPTATAVLECAIYRSDTRETFTIHSDEAT